MPKSSYIDETFSLEFYIEGNTKILWINIYAQDEKRVAMSFIKKWRIKYPKFKMRFISKKEFKQLTMQA